VSVQLESSQETKLTDMTEIKGGLLSSIAAEMSSCQKIICIYCLLNIYQESPGDTERCELKAYLQQMQFWKTLHIVQNNITAFPGTMKSPDGKRKGGLEQ